MPEPLPHALCIPLDRAAFCVDCDCVFRLPVDGMCPACGGGGLAMVAKWLNRKPDGMPAAAVLPKPPRHRRNARYVVTRVAGRVRFVPCDVYYL